MARGGVIVVTFGNDSANGDDSKFENEYVDATQTVEFVPETQIDPAHKAQVTNFLNDSWANMEELEKEDDNEVYLFPEKNFNLFSTKKEETKKLSL